MITVAKSSLIVVVSQDQYITPVSWGRHDIWHWRRQARVAFASFSHETSAHEAPIATHFGNVTNGNIMQLIRNARRG